MNFTTRAGKLYADATEIQLRGVSHFGFNAQILRPQFLWAMGWREQIAQIKALGFNAVRVPFVPDTLHSAAGEASTLHALNAELVGKTPLETLDVWMTEADRQGLYILLDLHSISRRSQYFHPFVTDPLHYDLATNGDPGWVQTWNRKPYTIDDWLIDLRFVAARYAHLPHFIGVDVFNEPRDRVRWTDPPVAWKPLAESAAAAILAANPNLLIFVQGLGNANFDGRERAGISINWGENFQPQTYAPLNIPGDKLVLSPHTYGPDVYPKPSFSAPNFPANLAADWEVLFGQFHGAHAVVPGEWGGRYGVGGTGAKDKQWQDAFVDYLIAKGMRSSFYWCYTPNSGDTGGILADDLTVREDKMLLLRKLWGQPPAPPVIEPPVVLPATWEGQVLALLTEIRDAIRAREP